MLPCMNCARGRARARACVCLGGEPGLKIFPAFSRDQGKKVYVQHLIEQNSAVVWDAVKDGGYFLIAGSSNNMPTAVLAALKSAIRTGGGLSDADADAFIKAMEKAKRLQQETWS